MEKLLKELNNIKLNNQLSYQNFNVKHYFEFRY